MRLRPRLAPSWKSAAAEPSSSDCAGAGVGSWSATNGVNGVPVPAPPGVRNCGSMWPCADRRGSGFAAPEGGRAYLRDLPDAEVHMLDSGHFAVEDHLDMIADHIKRFYGEKVATVPRATDTGQQERRR